LNGNYAYGFSEREIELNRGESKEGFMDPRANLSFAIGAHVIRLGELLYVHTYFV